MKISLNLKVLAGVFFAIAGLTTGAHAKTQTKTNDWIIRIKPQKGATLQNLRERLSSTPLSIKAELVPSLGIYLVTAPDLTGAAAIQILKSTLDLIYMIPDAQLQARTQGTQMTSVVPVVPVVPNDPEFSRQRNLRNPTPALTTDGDVGATEAWALGTGGKDASGNDIVVAIVDGGMDLTQLDLVQNIWTNSGEIADNGIDDDDNGYVDDVHGWNARQGNHTIPPDMHGTHVAGIVGAGGNNFKQITGVNWNVKLLPIAASSYKTSVVVAGYNYALMQKKLWIETQGRKGANIVAVNSSFGIDKTKCTDPEYVIWDELFNELGQVGILSVAAAPNGNWNVDRVGDIPTSCSSPYLITVTNTDELGAKVKEAGYGAKKIQIGAPAVSISSTVPGGLSMQATGTSMSAPHVTGGIALLHSIASKELNRLYLTQPDRAALQLKSIILSTVTPVRSLKKVTVSGGRLHLGNAAQRVAAFQNMPLSGK